MPIFTRTLKTPPFDVNMSDKDQIYLQFDSADMKKDLDVRPKSSSSLLWPSDHRSLSESHALLSAAQQMLTELDKPADSFLSLVGDFFTSKSMSPSNGLSYSNLVSGKSVDNFSGNNVRKHLPVADMKVKSIIPDRETKTSCKEPNLKERSRNVVSMYIPDKPFNLFSEDSVGKHLL